MNSALCIPTYQLYGESSGASNPVWVHCEKISVRCRTNNWHIVPHKHMRLFQILWIVKGGAKVNLDGQDLSMEEGSAISIPPGVVHGFEFHPFSEGYVVTFNDVLLDQTIQRLPYFPLCLSQVSWYKGPKGKHTMHSLLDCLDVFWQENSGQLLSLTALAEALFIAWIELVGQEQIDVKFKRRRSEVHYYRFNALMNKQFLQEKTVSWYASKLGVSPEHLNVICQHVAEKSALACIHERILIEAKRFLIFTHLSMEQIAQKLGFCDAAYFSRFFKRNTKIAPRDFQAQYN